SSMKHLASRGLAAIVIVAGLVIASPARADAAALPGVDEIVSSPNIAQVGHLDKTGPFAAENSYNTDWAFRGTYAFGGNYNGFTVYDIKNPKDPKIATQ